MVLNHFVERKGSETRKIERNWDHSTTNTLASAHCFLFIQNCTVRVCEHVSVCLCQECILRSDSSNFQFNFLSDGKLQLHFWIEMNTYQRCQKPNVLWWNSNFVKNYAVEMNLQCVLKCVNPWDFFVFSDRTNQKKTNSPNHSNGSRIEKEKEMNLCGRWNRYKKTMLNYDGRGRFMMRICGCMRACVCQYAARIFLYSFEKMATICQTSENISHISMYVRMFVCLLALICISYSKANDLFRSLSLFVCICLSVCYACLRKLCVCVSAFCFANWQ